MRLLKEEEIRSHIPFLHSSPPTDVRSDVRRGAKLRIQISFFKTIFKFAVFGLVWTKKVKVSLLCSGVIMAEFLNKSGLFRSRRIGHWPA